MTCPTCGAENPASETQCGTCGVDMEKVARFEESLARARECVGREEYDDAIPHLEVAVAAYGRNPEAARLLKESRERSKVVRQARARLAENPDDADAILEILRVLPDDGPARQAALDLLPRLTIRDMLRAHELAKVLPEGEARRLADELAARKARYDEAVAAAQRLLSAREYEKAAAAVEPVLAEVAYPPAVEIKKRAHELRSDPSLPRKAEAAGSTGPWRQLIWPALLIALLALVLWLALR